MHPKDTPTSHTEEEEHVRVYTERGEHAHTHSEGESHAEHTHSHSHVHAHFSGELSGKKIFWVTLLNATITIVEIVGGLLSGSLALLSDAMHNLSDTVAIALAYVANRIAQKPKDAHRTYGYKRAEILSALLNSAALLAISAMLIIEAVRRFRNPHPIDGGLMMTVALVGLLANLFSVFLLERDSHRNLNIKASYLHLLGDTVSSVGVLVGGLAIWKWGIVWIDPIITIGISLYILRAAWGVVKTTVDILMQAAAPLDYEAIRRDIEGVKGVQNIHHVHSWRSNENTVYFEGHLDLEDMNLSQADIVRGEIEKILTERYQISHITLQTECGNCKDTEFFNL